jgi:o-succinylbenzoate synthase
MTQASFSMGARHIQAIHCYPYRIPFRHSMTTAHGPITVREGAILEVVTEHDRHGFGEIAPLPAFRGEGLALALQSLPEIIEGLQGCSIHTALGRLEVEGKMLASVQSGLELALLDVLGQCMGQSIAGLLQMDRQKIKAHVQINAVVGSNSIFEAVAQARRVGEKGFACIKLKMVGDEREQVERVAAVREAIGPERQLRIDANEGWSFEQARNILKRCERYDIQYVEQPLLATDLEGACRLQKETIIPLAADEAIESLESARNVLAKQAARILILKPQLLGGLRNTQRIISEAAKKNIACVITSSIETGIGVVGALHLAAASPTIELACGLGTMGLLEHDLLMDNLSIQRGQLTVPDQPGLGVSLNRMALEQHGRR